LREAENGFATYKLDFTKQKKEKNSNSLEQMAEIAAVRQWNR